MDITWHNTNLAFTWLDNSWAIWSDKSGFVLGFHNWFHLDHIESWDSFCNAHDEVNFGLNGFKDGISSEGWWHIDDGSLSSSLFHTISNASEDWESEMFSSCLSLVDSSNNFGSVLDWLLGVESTLLICYSLVIYLHVYRSFPGRELWCVGWWTRMALSPWCRHLFALSAWGLVVS